MTHVKFYLDKADKNWLCPIHLFIRQKNLQIKIAIGVKIKKKEWDAKKQFVKEECYNQKYINSYIDFLRSETEKYLEKTPASQLTDKNVK